MTISFDFWKKILPFRNFLWKNCSPCGGVFPVTSANQNTPLTCSRTLILNIDVWEHAYYLKHYNLRAAYIDDWFRVVNWGMAEERFMGMNL